MVVVFFESNSHAELAGIFPTEELYMKCLPALEVEAKLQRMRVTESLDSVTIRKELKSLLTQEGFCTDNLWEVADVLHRYDCDEDQAHEMLEEVVNNEGTIGHIWEAIHQSALSSGIKKKDE